ncbi:MAG: NHL repeat-containing protein, partial [Planctomycetota bacterium]
MLPPTLPSRLSAGFLGALLLAVLFLAAPSLAATLGTSPQSPSASPPPSPLLRGEVRWRTTFESGLDSANVPWREPTAAIHAASGELLVADPAAGVVRVIVEDRPVAVLPTPPDLASGVAEFSTATAWSPSSLARGLDGSVLVGDPARRRLDRFTPDPKRAAGAWSWIERVDLGGEPLAPRAMVETADGIVLVDGDTDRLLEVRTAEEGPEVRVLDDAEIPGGWGRPMDLAVAEDGRLFVADADRHRVIRLDAEGRYLGAFGERGPFPGLFQDPVGLDLVGERLLVSDRLNHRISIFDL